MESFLVECGTSTPLTGRDDSAYTYDRLGNRKSVTHNGATSTYTLKGNGLNQYDQRTVPGVFDVAGAASPSATVTVNGSPSGVTRHGPYFFKGQALANSANPVYTTLNISDGTTTTPLPAYLAQTPETFTYDADGNLTDDGRWHYVYDADEVRQHEDGQFQRNCPSGRAERGALQGREARQNRLHWVETSAAAVGCREPPARLPSVLRLPRPPDPQDLLRLERRGLAKHGHG